jgi:AcrR family transcriptional regulator
MTTRLLESAPRPRGRPRSSQARDAIISAVLDLLAEGATIEALSMEAVAARAGVGKATIYRRWPDRTALILDAILATKEQIPELPGTSVREDLTLLVRAAGHCDDERSAKVVPCMLAELRRGGPLSEAYGRAVEDRREQMRQVIRRGMANGELRPDLDMELTLILLVGPMIMVMLGKAQRVERADLAERIVDAVLRGIAAEV